MLCGNLREWGEELAKDEAQILSQGNNSLNAHSARSHEVAQLKFKSWLTFLHEEPQANHYWWDWGCLWVNFTKVLLQLKLHASGDKIGTGVSNIADLKSGGQNRRTTRTTRCRARSCSPRPSSLRDRHVAQRRSEATPLEPVPLEVEAIGTPKAGGRRDQANS